MATNGHSRCCRTEMVFETQRVIEAGILAEGILHAEDAGAGLIVMAVLWLNVPLALAVAANRDFTYPLASQ
jgi:hypothetical protein